VSSTDPGSWYLAFTVGAVCILVVVIAVAVVVQLVRRIGMQLAEVTETLAAVRTSTAGLPAVGDINSDVRELNELLATTRLRLSGLVAGRTP
jgi:uncharacterized transporter YbjL